MNGLHHLVCERRTFSEKPHCHEHGYAQLIVPVDGSLSISLGLNRLEDTRNAVIYIPPFCNHSYSSSRPNNFFVFDIPETVFPNGKTDFRAKYPIDKRWEAIRTLVISEVGEANPVANQRIENLGRYIIGLLERPDHFPSLDYIHQNYHTAIHLQTLAGIEHYNESYFCEWFQRQVGQTPMDYIRTLRLDKARTLLRESEYSIMQIAQQVGYANQATLTKLFRKHLGISPAEFRRKSQKTAK